MFSLWTISAVFLILIGINICIYIGKRAYRTHVLLKNTVAYILLQYGVGVLVVYLFYLELMSLFGIDARPSITRELVLWSILTVTTASVIYLISKLAVVPADGFLYHVHKVLMSRIMDGTRPQAWRSTMRQFETELSKTTKYQMLPRFMQSKSAVDLRSDINRRRSSGDMRRPSKASGNSDTSQNWRSSSDSSLLNTSSGNLIKRIDCFKVALLKPVTCALIEAGVRYGEAVVTGLTHMCIRLKGIKITLGNVDEYYNRDGDKRARIPNRCLPPLMMNSAVNTKNQLNLDECNELNESNTSFE